MNEPVNPTSALVLYADASDRSTVAVPVNQATGAETAVSLADCLGRVLLIDANLEDTEVVTRYLTRAGFEVIAVTTGPAGLTAFVEHAPDLVVMDLDLSGCDGLFVCREIRKTSDVPVIMLTAWASESDRIVGLEYGADDYMVKPFSPRELVLRVAGLFRRARPAVHSGCPPKQPLNRQQLVDGELVLNLTSRTAHSRGQPLALTGRTFDLLSYLVQNAGQVFTREQLMADVWGWTFGNSSTVTVHIRRLREKIEPTPAVPVRIATVWGVGYRYDVGMGVA